MNFYLFSTYMRFFLKYLGFNSLWLLFLLSGCRTINKGPEFFTADNPKIQYTGRIDFSNPKLPRFWAPGVYIEFWFEGKACEIQLNDELPWNNSHNYISVTIDSLQVQRIRLTGKVNKLDLSGYLAEGKHKIMVCKSTESSIGYIELVGVRCKRLLKPGAKPIRKIEFYGNSVTCGTGSDTSKFPCGTPEWHDNHNAYLSYGPVTARSLNAQWMLTAVSGIGLVHSCCDMNIQMPDVYDKVDLQTYKIAWDFSRYQPDVITIALGQNDGIQDSALFCSHYVDFIHNLRKKYPSASIICLSSPMANEELFAVLKKYITFAVKMVNLEGDNNVTSFFFERSYNGGCDSHPNLGEHALIAEELTRFIKELKNW